MGVDHTLHLSGTLARISVTVQKENPPGGGAKSAEVGGNEGITVDGTTSEEAVSGRQSHCSKNRWDRSDVINLGRWVGEDRKLSGAKRRIGGATAAYRWGNIREIPG